jgi:Anti-sigma factor NepR
MTARRSAKIPTLGADLQRNIGRQLLSLYDAVLNERVPDRLRDLSQQVERKSTDRS